MASWRERSALPFQYGTFVPSANRRICVDSGSSPCDSFHSCSIPGGHTAFFTIHPRQDDPHRRRRAPASPSRSPPIFRTESFSKGRFHRPREVDCTAAHVRPIAWIDSTTPPRHSSISSDRGLRTTQSERRIQLRAIEDGPLEFTTHRGAAWMTATLPFRSSANRSSEHGSAAG